MNVIVLRDLYKFEHVLESSNVLLKLWDSFQEIWETIICRKLPLRHHWQTSETKALAEFNLYRSKGSYFLSNESYVAFI